MMILLDSLSDEDLKAALMLIRACETSVPFQRGRPPPHAPTCPLLPPHAPGERESSFHRGWGGSICGEK